MRVPKFLLPAPKNGQIWPKTGILGQISAFLAHLIKCLTKKQCGQLSWWFSVILVPKLLLTPIKIRIFGPKMAKFGPKSAFLVILGQILPFFAHFVQWVTKNNVNKVPRWVFRYVGNKIYDFSSKKKRIFCPKTTKFGPKLAFLVDMGQAMQVFSVPCWWVGWRLWRAGCISQDTYLLYIIFAAKANNYRQIEPEEAGVLKTLFSFSFSFFDSEKVELS